MKEIVEYKKKEVLQEHLGKPILATSKAYYGTQTKEPATVTIGILKEINDSFWIEGSVLWAKRDMHWPKVYRIMGVEYIPQYPHVVHPILNHYHDPDYRVYIFNSDSEGLETIEKIQRLEDITEIQ
ncbi:hypothetical protein J4477_01935 [Candidatus Pacearchaeota archaeon]|nr:hypothetical protein [Candidatus Pacearchaeota archaeon]